MGDRFVFITGAGSGIGRAAAQALTRQGVRVVAAVRDDAERERVEGSGDEVAGIVTFDVTDSAAVAEAPAQVDAIIREAGGGTLAAIVNSAGVVIAGPLAVLPGSDLRRQFDINVFGLMDVTRAFLPRLQRDGGRIVNIGSVGGRLAVPWTGAYSASKFAVRAICDAMRVELASRGVKVVLIEPGPIKTEIWDTSLAFGAQLREKLGEGFAAEYGAEADAVEAATHEIAARSIPVSKVGEAIAHAIVSAHPKPQYLIGGEARAQSVLSRLPPAIRDRVLSRALGLTKARRK